VGVPRSQHATRIDMSRRPSNALVATALAAAVACGALLPLMIVKGPLQPELVQTGADGPLPRQAALRGAYTNTCVTAVPRGMRPAGAALTRAAVRTRRTRRGSRDVGPDVANKRP
jgi:hypothetical protein